MIELDNGFPPTSCQIRLTSGTFDLLIRDHHMTVGGGGRRRKEREGRGGE